MIGITTDQFAEISLRERLKNLKFDHNDKVEEQEFVLSVKSPQREVWDLAGLGSIGVISGPPKSRKTALVSAIVAASLSGKEILGFNSKVKGPILYLDTEQRRDSFNKVNKNIMNWAGIPSGVTPDRYHAYCLRDIMPNERLVFAKEMCQELSPQILIIDIISDLMYDFNDLEQSNKLVEEIMKMAGKDTLTLLTLHLGKANMVLGHLGSALARKVDFLLEVRMDEIDYTESLVKCKLTRDVAMFPDFKIKQDKNPPRIYRPDLEVVNSWSNSWGGDAPKVSDTVDEIMDIGINSRGNTDDDLPF